MSIKEHPPGILEYLLKQVSLPDDSESLLGDFAEVYAYTAQDAGVMYALAWYLFHVIKLVPPYVSHTLAWIIAMLKNYSKIAIRNVRKNKGYSLINLSGLAIGTACTMLILLWVRDELSYDRFHENASTIYRVVNESVGNDVYYRTTPAPLEAVLRNDIPEIENVVRLHFQSDKIIRYEDKVFKNWRGVSLDTTFFEIFTFPLIKGDPSTALLDISSVLLTEGKALACFGEADPIGKTLDINGDLTQVTGVLEDIPHNSEIQFDYIRPVGSLRELTEYQEFIWNWFAFDTYVKLRSRENLATVNEKIFDILNTNRPWMESSLRTFLQPLTTIHLYNLGGGGGIQYVLIFSLTAVFILLIACINFMNLSTARSANRAKEVGLRKVVGSSRAQIMKQFFGECLLSSFLAMLLSVVIVVLLLPWFNQLSGKQLSLHYNDVSILSAFLAIAVITGFLSGTYPALILSSFKPVDVLKGNLLQLVPWRKGVKTTGAGFRRILVVTQFTLSIGLMICTGVVYQQLQFMRNGDIGFEAENLIQVTIPEAMQDQHETLKSAFAGNTDITDVSRTSRTSHGCGLDWEGNTFDEQQILHLGTETDYALVDWEFVETLDMKIVAGRNFSRSFTTDLESAFLINEEAALRWELDDPVGKYLRVNMTEGAIIGVFQNRHFGLKERVKPEILYLSPNTDWDTYNYLNVRIRQDQTSQALASLHRAWNRHSPGIPIEYHFFNDMIDEQYGSEDQLYTIFNTFTLLALFISCLGLFGIASFMTEQRNKEIGVRKVLGASIVSILRMLSVEFLRWVILACLVAGPIAYYLMEKWLENYPYRTTISPWLILLMCVLSLVLALVTVGYQSLKAARSNPVETLKYE